MCFRVCCDSAGHLRGKAVMQDAPLLTLTVLSDELVQAGWEKCWSKRENRPYYFNRFTNQSLWEMPVLGQHDVIVSARSPWGAVPGLGCSWSVDLRLQVWEGLLCLQSSLLSPLSGVILRKCSSARCLSGDAVPGVMHCSKNTQRGGFVMSFSH